MYCSKNDSYHAASTLKCLYMHFVQFFTLCVSSFVQFFTLCVSSFVQFCTLCVSSFYRFVILWLHIFLSYIVPSVWYDWNCYMSLNRSTFVALYLHWVYRNCLFNLVAYYYFCYFHLLFSTFFFLRTFSWSLKFIFDTKFSDNYMLSMLSNLFLS
jgi:hypothetical protein